MLTNTINSSLTKAKSISSFIEFSMFERAVELEVTRSHFFMKLIFVELYASKDEFKLYRAK